MYTYDPYLHYLRECQTGVLAEIILGNQLIAGAGETGISRIYLTGETFLVPSGMERVSAFLRLDAQTGRLLIHFLGCSISETVRQKYFSDGSFLMESGYPLGGQVARELNLVEGDHWISTGNYPLLDDGEMLTVSVSIGRLIALPAAFPALRIAA